MNQKIMDPKYQFSQFWLQILSYILKIKYLGLFSWFSSKLNYFLICFYAKCNADVAKSKEDSFELDQEKRPEV